MTMLLPKELTKETPVSKGLSFVLFIAFPFIGFYLGVLYKSASYLEPVPEYQMTDTAPVTFSRTYRNSELGFEFKYPSSFEVESTASSSDSLVLLSKKARPGAAASFVNVRRFVTDSRSFEAFRTDLKSSYAKKRVLETMKPAFDDIREGIKEGSLSAESGKKRMIDLEISAERIAKEKMAAGSVTFRDEMVGEIPAVIYKSEIPGWLGNEEIVFVWLGGGNVIAFEGGFEKKQIYHSIKMLKVAEGRASI